MPSTIQPGAYGPEINAASYLPEPTQPGTSDRGSLKGHIVPILVSVSGTSQEIVVVTASLALAALGPGSNPRWVVRSLFERYTAVGSVATISHHNRFDEAVEIVAQYPPSLTQPIMSGYHPHGFLAPGSPGGDYTIVITSTGLTTGFILIELCLENVYVPPQPPET